jgi:GT2 family glycosyltransferase
VVYPLPRQKPLVSVIIPTRDKVDLLRQCLEGLLNRTRYPALEIVLLDNGSSEPETLQYLQEIGQQPRVRVLRDAAEFNWGAINNYGVRNARGEIILLLNNDTDVVDPNWLDEMVAQAVRPEIGVVGAKLLYHDLTIQHAGLVLGPDGHAFHRFRHVPDTVSGYRNELAMVRTVSAVTGACLAMRRSVFDEVGGIEETGLTVTWSDVDLCFRVREAGYRVICTPFARLLHLELATRGADDTPERAARAELERQFMMKKWPGLANEDPFFNPNIRLAEGETRLAAPPRPGWPAGSRGDAA